LTVEATANGDQGKEEKIFPQSDEFCRGGRETLFFFLTDANAKGGG
jgi:hypothetical protein